MKIFAQFLLIPLFLSAINLFGQNSNEPKKFIEVTGSAEKLVKPDEIELEIVLIEYLKEGKIIKLDKIEKDFFIILKKNNIDTETLNLNGSDTYNWWYWWNNRNKPIKTKTFNLSVKSETDFLKLTQDLNTKFVESISVTEKKNKNIQHFRKDVKIQAIKAAKEKAGYLLESVGEQLGSIISVEEVPEEVNPWNTGRNPLSNTMLSSVSSESDEISNVSVIKLRYEIKVKFEIK